MGGGNYETREIREKEGKKRHRAQYFLGGLGGLGVKFLATKRHEVGEGTTNERESGAENCFLSVALLFCVRGRGFLCFFCG